MPEAERGDAAELLLSRSASAVRDRQIEHIGEHLRAAASDPKPGTIAGVPPPPVRLGSVAGYGRVDGSRICRMLRDGTLDGRAGQGGAGREPYRDPQFRGFELAENVQEVLRAPGRVAHRRASSGAAAAADRLLQCRQRGEQPGQRQRSPSRA